LVCTSGTVLSKAWLHNQSEYTRSILGLQAVNALSIRKIAMVKPIAKSSVPFYDLVIEITKALGSFFKADHMVLSRKDNDVADSLLEHRAMDTKSSLFGFKTKDYKDNAPP
jgi:hypothetical protein